VQQLAWMENRNCKHKDGVHETLPVIFKAVYVISAITRMCICSRCPRPVVLNWGGILPLGGISWVQGRNFHFI